MRAGAPEARAWAPPPGIPACRQQSPSIAASAGSIRRVPVRVISVGRWRGNGVDVVARDYAAKIARYCAFEHTLLRPNPKQTSNIQVQADAEAERMLRSVHAQDWVVVLDERGRSLSSAQFAALVADAAASGCRSLVFCVGGPHGLGTAVRQRANASLSLSPLVLNHEVALLVLLEQLYRAWTILRGEKYHHE